jgi:DNA-binding CsgD family transcriptional regulator
MLRRELLIKWFAGDTIAEIAIAHGRSQYTIRNTLTQIGFALGVRTRVGVFRECLRLRIVTLDEVEQTAGDR